MIGMNRIESRNSINQSVTEELNHRIREFEADPKLDVGVLYGVGGSFSSGYDLNEIQSNGFKGNMEAPFPSRRLVQKPMVCAVNGYCLGSGFELALMCDLRVVEDSAVMGFYNRRFGIPIIDGGTVRLPSMVGVSRAMDLILTGRAINGKEAMDMGLACRLVATGTSLGQALNVAVQVAKFPQFAVRHDRNSINKSAARDFEAAVRLEQEGLPENIDDLCKEGATRFLEENIGKGGKFYDIKKKVIADWEQDEIDLEKESSSTVK